MKHECKEENLTKNGVSGIDLPNTCYLFRIHDTHTPGIFLVTCVDCDGTVMIVKDVTGNTKIKTKLRKDMERLLEKKHE